MGYTGSEAISVLHTFHVSFEFLKDDVDEKPGSNESDNSHYQIFRHSDDVIESPVRQKSQLEPETCVASGYVAIDDLDNLRASEGVVVFQV